MFFYWGVAGNGSRNGSNCCRSRLASGFFLGGGALALLLAVSALAGGARAAEISEESAEEDFQPILTPRIAFQPVLLAPTAPNLSGMSLGLSLAPAHHLAIGVAVDLIQPVALSTGTHRAILSRWALRLPASLWSVVHGVSLSLNVGPVIESLRIHDLSYQPSDPDVLSPRTSAALGASVRIQFGALPWLAPYVEAGGDFFFKTVAVVAGDEVIIERCPTVPRFCFGIAIVLLPS